MTTEASFFIGTLAEEVGVSPDTIRFYEDQGVLPEAKRSDSGYRVYRAEDVERLRFIRQAQALGLTLDEIRDVLDLVDEGVEPCAHVTDRLRARLDEVEARITELQGLRERLSAALARARAAQSDASCRCRIIENDASPASEGSGGGGMGWLR